MPGTEVRRIKRDARARRFANRLKSPSKTIFLPMKFLRILPVFLALALGFTGCVALDRHDQSLLEQHHVPGALIDRMMRGERLELPDIVVLSKRQLPDPFILDYLRSTYAVYQLASSDVLDLTRAGVGKVVIDYLLATPSMYGPPRYPYGYYPGFYGPYPYYNYPPPLIIGNPHFHHHW